MMKEEEIPGIHGTIYQEAEEHGVELLYLVDTVYSDKIDYHVDIFKCKRGFAIFTYWSGEHNYAGKYPTLRMAIEEAEEAIEDQESVILEEKEEKEQS